MKRYKLYPPNPFPRPNPSYLWAEGVLLPKEVSVNVPRDAPKDAVPRPIPSYLEDRAYSS